ncbi:hypothetical protein [Paraburkholderia youngii]|uniref:hypothetical protein n=1 Tax=Paraburkholderia youngii TaxID=2782701 RepID=UPI003D1DE1B9
MKSYCDSADNSSAAQLLIFWKEGGASRALMQGAGAALVTGLAGGNAVGGAAGAAVASIAGGKLNELSSAIAGADPTGNASMNEALGNIVANAIATGAGGAVGGESGAFSGYNVDRFNRQLHPDERKWAKDNAETFAQFYADQTGQTITEDLAQNMLLASGYRLVDASASAGPAPAGSQYATAFISQNAGSMFTATAAEYKSPFMYGNNDGSRTPEQNALPGAVPNPALGLAIAAGLASPALLPALASIPGAPIFGIDGALGAGAMTSAAGTGAIGAGITAGSQYIRNGSINPIDVAGAFGTGVAGSYGGLLWNVGVNALGGATTTALNNILQGKNDSVIGAGIASGVFSTVGYSAGSITANTINSIMRPTINNAGSWSSSGVWSGSGYNLFNLNNTAVIGGGFTGGTLQEIVQGAINGAQEAGNKK